MFEIKNSRQFIIEAYTLDRSRLLWREVIDNLTVDEGLNTKQDMAYNGTTVAQWYVFITNADPTFAPGDTMSTHPGWVENQSYDETDRQAYTTAAASGGVITNSASRAVFTFSSDQTIGGAGITSSIIKGSSAGLLMGGGAFSQGNRTLTGVLEVTATDTIVSS